MHTDDLYMHLDVDWQVDWQSLSDVQETRVHVAPVEAIYAPGTVQAAVRLGQAFSRGFELEQEMDYLENKLGAQILLIKGGMKDSTQVQSGQQVDLQLSEQRQENRSISVAFPWSGGAAHTVEVEHEGVKHIKLAGAMGIPDREHREGF